MTKTLDLKKFSFEVKTESLDDPIEFHYRGKYVGISCPKAAAKTSAHTDDLNLITCDQCLLNLNSVRPNINARILSENPEYHGTLFGYLEAGCRCRKCNLFWNRRAAIEKFKHKLSREYGKKPKEIVEFLNRQVSTNSATLFVDVLIEDPALFRSLALSNL